MRESLIFYFRWGACVLRSGGACALEQWRNGQSGPDLSYRCARIVRYSLLGTRKQSRRNDCHHCWTLVGVVLADRNFREFPLRVRFRIVLYVFGLMNP